ncbi:hypothetical protein ACFP1Z_03025 [Streptomyces gamaensis]|uniref:Uncharacterized protein n=1 Tax=Streptomyces gamaensis TaxID=1763542 RepID=A0ABW0YSL4_9ACTN
MNEQGSTPCTVRQVVRDVVAEVAPEEIPVLDGLSRLDDDEALRRLTQRRRSREPLGFGLDEVTTLATALTWVAVQESVKQIVEPATDGLSRSVMSRIRRMFRRRSVPTVVPVFTREQLAEVQRRILDSAAQAGFDTDRATVLAERTVAKLALGAPDPEPGASDRDQADER